MSEELLEQLRKLSCVQGKQKTWISELSDNQIIEVFQRLRNDENAKSIARHAQQAWGVNPNSSVHAISQGILKFKRRCAHLLTAPAPPTQPGDECLRPLTVGYGPEDTLENLEYIAQLQRDRIVSFIEREKETGVKHPHLSRDLQALATLQKVLLKQKAYELLHDDPLKQRRWARLEKDVQKKFGGLLQTMTDAGREKLSTALKKFMEKIEERSVTIEMGPDGRYYFPAQSVSNRKQKNQDS